MSYDPSDPSDYLDLMRVWMLSHGVPQERQANRNIIRECMEEIGVEPHHLVDAVSEWLEYVNPL